MEIENRYELDSLGSRAGFNSALRHFKAAIGYSGFIEEGYNLADLINESLENQELKENQIKPIVSALLADKFEYAYQSANLKKNIENVDELIKTVEKWKSIQLVVAYYTSEGVINLINPEIKESWKPVLPLQSDEFIICYAGTLKKDLKESVTKKAIEDFFKLLNGGKVRDNKDFMQKPSVAKEFIELEEEEDTPVASSEQVTSTAPVSGGATGRKKMSTRYSVTVTNELFHNGNVEAWKKIVQSYQHSHPGSEVHIWYEGEKINDINALFKWGKVKHGCPIMFGVEGVEIIDISKLRKYLFEGASRRFEAFLHGHPGSILELF